MYYLSHSVHFTQRCLYILTWTPPQPASLAGALSPPLTLQQLKADLRLWLQMLAQHVPNAKVLLVGTRDDNSAEYQLVQYQVEAAVDAEIEQLNSRVEPECAKLQKMKKACDDGVAAAKSHWTHIEVGRQFDASGGDGSDGDEDEMQWWLKQSEAAAGLEEWQQRIAREVFDGMQRAQMLQQRMSLMKLRDRKYAQLQRVERDRSFTVDCLSGRGVAYLQAQLSGVCSSHVAGMGEKLPGWWLSVPHALREGDARNPVSKTLSMRKADAIQHIRRSVPELSSIHKRRDFASTDEEVSDVGIWSALQFWADLGRIFLYEDFVLPDPLDLLQLIKPLLHHDPPLLLHETCSEDDKKLLLSSCCELSSPSRDACMGYLKRLKNQAVLHRGLLPLLPAWREDPSFHQAILKFLAECHLTCVTGDASDVSADVLVTARSRDLPAFHSPYPPAAAGLSEDDLSQHEELCGKHDIIRSQFNAALVGSDCCRVLFLVSRHHIGIISRLQALIHTARPSEINLVVKAAKDSLFICRGAQHTEASTHRCAVRVLPFCDDVGADSVLSAFRNNDGPLWRESDRRTKCGIVVAASEMALFAFLVRCVEDTLKRWSVCADFQCFVEGPPEVCSFIQFDSPPSHYSSALPLSAVLAGNLWSNVVPGVQMRDIFSRQRHCAMFLSYASNEWENTGTRHACETIRNGFQEAALCSVWMDRVDASQSIPGWKLLVREGLQAANVYIVCLTPLYLTRPNCLTELSDILTLVKMSPQRKRLVVLPLHPAMTASGRQSILVSGYVLLTDFQDPAVTRKHVLSAAALKLLEDLRSHDRGPGGEADSLTDACLNTEPWLSASPDRQQNPKWNGVKATLDMCSGIVKLYGRSLGSLMVCADDRPISDRPFLDESSPCFSIPPSLEPLDPSSIVNSKDGFDHAFHLFRVYDAVHLVKWGFSSKQVSVLVQNSTQALQSFPRYLQRLLKDIDFKYAQNAIGGCEDLPALVDWMTIPPRSPATRKVVFRVEGPDDQLLLHAIIQLKFPSLQRPSGHSWSDFTYNSEHTILKIRDRDVLQSRLHNSVGIISFVRSLQAAAQSKRFALNWLDLDDQDLKAFDTSTMRPDPATDYLRFVTWRWGRAIENYLLPVTAPAALYLTGHVSVSKLTSEVFVTIARHFFPVHSASELPQRRLFGFIGAGWGMWSDLLQHPDITWHRDQGERGAANSLKIFAINLVTIMMKLVQKRREYGREGSNSDKWLMHFAREHIKLVQSERTGSVNWSNACESMLSVSSVLSSKLPLPSMSTSSHIANAPPQSFTETPEWGLRALSQMDDSLYAVLPGLPQNVKLVDEAALWFRLPSLCSFLASLCSCSWLGEHSQRADELKQAAASALLLVQHALCVLLLGCDPSFPAPQRTLLAHRECDCFLPLVRGNTKRCSTCGRHSEDHELPPCSSSTPTEFLVELCRVGSVGWQSHDFMEAVFGKDKQGRPRTHLGEQFAAEHIDESHRLYEQHVRPLLEDIPSVDPNPSRESIVTPDEITVHDGREMKPLLQMRRGEFDRFCSLISLLTGTPISSLQPAGTPASSVADAGSVLHVSRAAASTTTPRSKAGGGAAAAPKPKPACAPPSAAAAPETAPSTPVVAAGTQRTPSAASPLAGAAASSTVTHSPKAGAAGSAAAAPQSRPAVLAMTALDVATAVGRIGRPYTSYEQSLVDNGIDGSIVARLVSKPESEALRFLESLGLSSLHSSRVLMEFQSLSQQ